MDTTQKQTDVILIGAGIMSATLGALLKELAPDWNITVFEKLPTAGEESSNEWNNAGTGHSALCEMNYTVEKADGTMDISKAIRTSEQFQLSRQFWAYLADRGLLGQPQNFIMPLAHISMVQGKDNVRFLRNRYDALIQNPLFKGMSFTNHPAVLKEWMPLVMEGRTSREPIAATRIETGTDVNFGALTRIMFEYLQDKGVKVYYNHDVKDLKRLKDGHWEIKVQDQTKRKIEFYAADFVFIGGGGGSLSLLQKSGIPEGKGIGGFPVSGLFMVCKNPEIAQRLDAKIYGKAKVGAPPMSVPHLDTRYINNQKMLVFGPFAGFSPRFLKTGSLLDLVKSVKPHNLLNMLMSACKEIPLIKYLVQQLLLTDQQRLQDLQEFVPDARLEDWDMVVAGQRVQVIKETKEGGKGTLQFGTEVVSAADGSIAALLGASPGASTAVYVMLEVLSKCFPQEMAQWEPKIKEMIPSYGLALMDHPDLFQEIQQSTAKSLGLAD